MNHSDFRPNNPSNLWRIIDIISWGTEYLKEKGFESGRLLIELLLAHVLHCKRIDLYLNYEKPLTGNELNNLKVVLKRLLNHEPLQYIVGKTQFLDLEILLNRRVFIPRPETEILAKQVMDDFNAQQQARLEILDIGCGCGAIALALAKYFPRSRVLAIDISDEALNQTEENAKINSISNVITKKLNIMDSLPDGKFDIIVSNPPYLSAKEYRDVEPNLLFEPKESLTDDSDGFSFYRRFAKIFPELLAVDGKFYLEVGYNQAEQVAQIFAKHKFIVKFLLDFNAIKRVISN